MAASICCQNVDWDVNTSGHDRAGRACFLLFMGDDLRETFELHVDVVLRQ